MNTRPSQSTHDSLEPGGDFATSLRHFRSAVHHVAERETSKPVPAGWLIPAQRRRRSAQRRLVLAWACAALFCVGMLPLAHQAKHVDGQPLAVVQNDAADTALASDTALLEQVDTDVSESVPSSLAPLAALDSWSSTASTNELKSSLNKPEKKNVAR